MSTTPLPTPTLTTARLALTPLTLRDTAACFALFADDAVVEHVGFGPFAEQAQVEELVRAWEALQVAGEEYRWGMRRQGEARLIGLCRLKGPHSPRRRAELGYMLARDCWGQGYAGEAVRAIVAHAFGPLGLNRVEAMVYAENETSRRLLTKLGFRQEGYLHQHAWEKGRYRDDVIYALLADEYRARVP
jgi:[ribosomal protein S5]-alanine N-acetyltransferase